MMQPKIAAFVQKRRIHTLWLLAAFFLLVALTTKPYWDDDSIHEVIEIAGLVLVFFAILGRLWSILYIGTHKNKDLVVEGPYSMTRNPLYFASLLGISGVGLMSGSLVLSLAMTIAFSCVFIFTARREASYLQEVFGQQYAVYAARTPFFWPNPFLYRRMESVTFSQRALTSTFRDSLFLLALFPILEAIEYLQSSGYLPVVLVLY